MTFTAEVDRLNELRSLVAAALPVTANHYPSLGGPDELVVFCVRHSALHFSKTSGQLAAMAERLDHGGSPDISEATRIVANSLINALKLAEELSIPTDQIMTCLDLKYDCA